MNEAYKKKYDDVFDFLDVHVAGAQEVIDDIMESEKIFHRLGLVEKLTSAMKAWDEFKQFREVLRDV